MATQRGGRARGNGQIDCDDTTSRRVRARDLRQLALEWFCRRLRERPPRLETTLNSAEDGSKLHLGRPHRSWPGSVFYCSPFGLQQPALRQPALWQPRPSALRDDSIDRSPVLSSLATRPSAWSNPALRQPRPSATPALRQPSPFGNLRPSATRPFGNPALRQPGPSATRPFGNPALRQPGPSATRPFGNLALRQPGLSATLPFGSPPPRWQPAVQMATRHPDDNPPPRRPNHTTGPDSTGQPSSCGVRPRGEKKSQLSSMLTKS